MLVVWERVIPTDYQSPSNSVLGIIADGRAVQFWDPTRTLSKYMGERPGEKKSIVWDWVGLYAPDVRWEGRPPEPLFVGRTVVDDIEGLRKKVAEVLGSFR